MAVFSWKKIIVPLLENLLGKDFQKDVVSEFAYGHLLDEKLDFIVPTVANKRKNAIVHIHGGGFISGSKGKIYSKPLLKFSEAGYPVFSVNYPRAPEQQHPYLLQSLLNALVWIKKNYPEYDSIHLIGDSAGGNLAMMLGIYLSNPSLVEIVSDLNMDSLPKVKSVSNLYGVNDSKTWIEDGFPSAKLFTKMYLSNTNTPHIPIVPMEFKVFDHLPPTFIVGAGKDKLLRSSKIWAERIAKQFDQTQFKIYDGANHGFFSAGKGSDELSDDILHFINQANK